MNVYKVIFQGSIRDRMKLFFESGFFQHLIVTIIIINALLIGAETSPTVMDLFGTYIDFFDMVILVAFTIEIILKIFVYRLSFFKSSWNLFDFFIVGISIIPAAGSFAVFRALRIIRTLRLLKSVPRFTIDY